MVDRDNSHGYSESRSNKSNGFFVIYVPYPWKKVLDVHSALKTYFTNHIRLRFQHFLKADTIPVLNEFLVVITTVLRFTIFIFFSGISVLLFTPVFMVGLCPLMIGIA